MKKAVLLCLTVAALLGCETQPRARETGALGGAALGAGLGAIIGHQTGNAGAGIAIGSAFGALSGAVLGNEVDKESDRLDQQQQRLSEQDRALEENRRIIEELKRAGTDVRTTDRGVVVNLPDVLFDFDSARLTGAAEGSVSEIARVLGDVPHRQVLIEGHTDSMGTVAYNQRLSENRARSVASALTSHGVQRRRVTVRGYGERDPIASNKTESGRQRNRRVEVIIQN